MKTQLIAHRGASAIAPENTLSAFQLAVSAGAAGVEFDVQLTAEGIPVVIHDTTLDRTTLKPGNVRNSSLTELKQLDAGKWFDIKFSGEKIPTLQEVLNLLKHTNLAIYPELKNTSTWSLEDLQFCLDLIVHQGWLERCRVLSFDAKILDLIQQLYPQLSLGLNRIELTTDIERQKLLESSYSLSFHYRFLLNHPQFIQCCQMQQREVMAWTVDDQETIQKLSELGVHQVMSNSIFRVGAV